MEEKIKQLLTAIVHPETGQDIVTSGFIEHTAAAAGKVTVVLRFAKTRDPFALKIKNRPKSSCRRHSRAARYSWSSRRAAPPPVPNRS